MHSHICPNESYCTDMLNRGYYAAEIGCVCKVPTVTEEAIDEFLTNNPIGEDLAEDLIEEDRMKKLSDGLAEKIIDIIDDPDYIDIDEAELISEKLAEKLKERLGPVTPADYKKIARSVINIIQEEASEEMRKFW